MKHLKPTSRSYPAMAQFEPILSFIGIFQALFGLPGIFLQQAQTLGNVLITWTQLDILKGT